MAESWDQAFAKKFKERDNVPKIGNLVGQVINPFPDIRISILDGNGTLTRDQLYCCDHVLQGYKREIKLTEFATDSATSTHKLTSGGSLENYTYTSMSIPESTTTMEYTDSLSVGDLVLLMPTESEQTWFIVDKVTKL
ncbi:DUF2577 family protein [Schinkia azotoformans]|uniref:DUF2577 family protein n=1 Tax=Schinkia azotoformans TaxID=1454 RepID=UPI002DB8A419|nr:DUF2577 family protein [Schinkia azotoformans]MEC1757371.1 DUF2577 family protein [Schinkia azotoformans]